MSSAQFAALVADFAARFTGSTCGSRNELLPMATRHLTDADWDAVDAAFLGHTDPLLGVQRGDEYRDLFRRIVDLAPRPIGVAAAR